MSKGRMRRYKKPTVGGRQRPALRETESPPPVGGDEGSGPMEGDGSGSREEDHLPPVETVSSIDEFFRSFGQAPDDEIENMARAMAVAVQEN